MNENKFTILMVDDSADAREILEGYLSDHLAGSKFIKARDGAEALKIIATTHLDLVITDEVMPKKSGSDVVKAAWDLGINIPFIILTGLRAQDVVLPKKDQHRVQVMEKPLDLSTLRSVLEGALRVKLPEAA